MAGLRPGDLNSRLLEHREAWEAKETVRLIYRDYYRRLFTACTQQGTILDVGGGSAHIKDFRQDAVVLDILPFPGVDVVADAHDLPFGPGRFASIVMLDVLHHLDRPVVFLNEVARVLKVGGRLAMIEPAVTPWSWWFYRFLHHEPVEVAEDPFQRTERRPAKDPFDANQAIPSLMFGKRKGLSKFADAVPQFRIIEVDWLSLAAYPLSGGFKRWCAMPPSAVRPCLAIEERIPLIIRRLLAFRLFVVLERVAR